VNLEKLVSFRQALRANPNTSKTLFRGVAETTLTTLQQ
jgi:hypothetical protein